MALSLTMGSEGLTFNDPGNRKNMGKPFFFRSSSNTNYSLTGSWTQGHTTSNFTIPKKSHLITHFHYPIRNDSGSWGGGYSRMYYSVNDSAWIFCGDYGYCRGAMGTGKAMISGADWQNAFDFSGMANDFTVKFRYDHRTHDGSANTGSSHGYSNADNTNYHGATAPWIHYLVVQGWQYL